jgi:HAD superfamily hydrolase (TIGR01509 family)
MRFADLDAVTIDAFGTLVELEDPIPALQEALRARGIGRSRAQVEAGFRAEVDYYGAHMFEGRDEESLRRLRVECARVFLAAAEADLPADEFAPAYVAALRFHVLDGVAASLTALHSRGLELAVVGNWDVGLTQYLDDLGLSHFFSVVLPVARKPSPDRLLEALEQLRVRPERALHVGDEPADEEAAGAAGMHFRPAPLASALATLE